ncbi:hypothetical protein D9V32_14170 [Mycetocola tolaasinivorans]|uniref:Glycosyltransferase RgtA/B/C/D-like domain-containing protein n=1 Tax=Mycetocola tolaasinivorans TaxID=76635 RepID=A0A3L7A257_9MICO|nr:glycosyltransferase family 39 protein [Mycetocola tolaasinivorans]RLP73671.1 hypothetical protein D9V32_14170 [Mycetocola tolaasinivorans]
MHQTLTTPTSSAPVWRTLPWPVLALLGLIAVAISVTGSWIPSLWGDEAASIMSAQRDWGSLWAMLGTVDAVHGLYYAFLHLWIDIFGASPFSVRLPSALAVGGAAILLARLATLLAGRGVGVVAALLFATVPRVTYYGTETRAYAFTMLLVIWLLLVLVRLVARREPRVLPWLGFAVLFALSSVVFIYTVLFVVVFAVIVIAMRPGLSIVLRAALWSALGAILAVPVVIYAYLEREQVAFLHSRDGLTMSALFETPWFSQQLPALIGWALIVIGLVLAVVAWLLRRSSGVRARALRDLYRPEDAALPGVLTVALPWLVVPSVLLALGTTVTPLYSPRYLAFTAPAIALLMAVGLVALTRLLRARWLVPILVIAVVWGSLPTYLGQRTPYPRNGGVDWNTLSETVAEHARPGDSIIFDQTAINAKKPRLAKYLYPEAFAGLKDVGLKTRFDDTDGLWDRAYSTAETVQRLDGAETVWLVRAGERFSTDQAKSDAYVTELERAGYEQTESFELHRSILVRFELTR